MLKDTEAITASDITLGLSVMNHPIAGSELLDDFVNYTSGFENLGPIATYFFGNHVVLEFGEIKTRPPFLELAHHLFHHTSNVDRVDCFIPRKDGTGTIWRFHRNPNTKRTQDVVGVPCNDLHLTMHEVIKYVAKKQRFDLAKHFYGCSWLNSKLTLFIKPHAADDFGYSVFWEELRDKWGTDVSIQGAWVRGKHHQIFN